jgi:hypothetical protein
MPGGGFGTLPAMEVLVIGGHGKDGLRPHVGAAGQTVRPGNRKGRTMTRAKQRGTDRDQRQPTSERHHQPRPRQQRGQRGPERTAG